MTRARRVSAGLLLFGLLCSAGGGSTLAGSPEGGSAGLRAASASPTIKSRVFKPQATHPTPVHLSGRYERRAQIFDLYTPSHASHLLLLRYPLWFQFGPVGNYSEVLAQRTVSRPPLTSPKAPGQHHPHPDPPPSEGAGTR